MRSARARCSGGWSTSRGFRTTLTLVAEGTFWGLAPLLIHRALLGGLLGLPVYSAIRQSVAALTSEGRRRSAFEIDAISVDTSLVIGPALGVLLELQRTMRATQRALNVTRQTRRVTSSRCQPRIVRARAATQ